MKVESPNGATLYVQRSNGDWVQLDSDGIIIGRIRDTSQKVTLKASLDGQDSIFMYDLSDLVLEPSA